MLEILRLRFENAKEYFRRNWDNPIDVERTRALRVYVDSADRLYREENKNRYVGKKKK